MVLVNEKNIFNWCILFFLLIHATSESFKWWNIINNFLTSHYLTKQFNWKRIDWFILWTNFILKPLFFSYHLNQHFTTFLWQVYFIPSPIVSFTPRIGILFFAYLHKIPKHIQTFIIISCLIFLVDFCFHCSFESKVSCPILQHDSTLKFSIHLALKKIEQS